MQMALADVAFGIMALVGLVVGGRLVRLWLRTRQLPELVFGAATLGQALSGVGFWLVPSLLPRDAVWAGGVACLLMETAGTVAICLGAWLIFRRGEGWARATAFGMSFGVLTLGAARLAISHPAQAAPGMPLGHGADLPLAQTLTNVGVAAAYGWAALEATRYGLLMRRRLALGLDSPILVHQFLLWGLASASIVAINLVVIGVVNATGKPAEAVPAAHAGIALLGLVGAVALWGAFFPPRFYRAWVLRGSEAAG